MTKLKSLAKCDMGMQREKTQKKVICKAMLHFFIGLRILASRRVTVNCLYHVET